MPSPRLEGIDIELDTGLSGNRDDSVLEPIYEEIGESEDAVDVASSHVSEETMYTPMARGPADASLCDDDFFSAGCSMPRQSVLSDRRAVTQHLQSSAVATARLQNIRNSLRRLTDDWDEIEDEGPGHLFGNQQGWLPSVGHIWSYREYQARRDAGAFMRADMLREVSRLEASVGTIGVDLDRLELNIRRLEEEVQRESAVVGECWSQLHLVTGYRAYEPDDSPPDVHNQTFTILPEAVTGGPALNREETSQPAHQDSPDAGSMDAQPPSTTRGSLTSPQVSPGESSLEGSNLQGPEDHRPVAVVQPQLSNVRLIHMPSGSSTPHRPERRGHYRRHSVQGLRPFSYGEPPQLCPEYLEAADDSDIDL